KLPLSASCSIRCVAGTGAWNPQPVQIKSWSSVAAHFEQGSAMPGRFRLPPEKGDVRDLAEVSAHRLGRFQAGPGFDRIQDAAVSLQRAGRAARLAERLHPGLLAGPTHGI